MHISDIPANTAAPPKNDPIMLALLDDDCMVSAEDNMDEYSTRDEEGI